LAHGGSGLPLLLEQVFKLAHVGPGDTVPQGGAATYTPEQLHAARLAYVSNALLGAGVIVAVIAIARQLLPPLGVLAAAGFAAFDPMLVRLSGQLLTESGYILCFALAVAAVLKSRDHPAWLVAVAPLMAFAHMLRINGLVMLVMLLVFAVLLHRRRPGGVPWKWVGAAALGFIVIAMPYLVWRAHYLPGAFDYGTNQRWFTDNQWDFSDNYWQHYSYSKGGPRETAADYFRTHTVGQAALRLYQSVQFQIIDLFGSAGSYATKGDGPVLNPLLAAFVIVGLVRLPGRREHWSFHLALGFTMLTFVWLYPPVRSPRYFAPLIAVAIPFAVAALRDLSGLAKRAWTASGAAVALFALVFAVGALWSVAGGLAKASDAGLLGLVAAAVVVWLLAVLSSPLLEAWRERRDRMADEHEPEA
jgi:4-amino-4-deoxy-L-arabinose transferase-like glycosyltransferase